MDGPTRLERGVNGNGRAVTGNGDSRENGGQRSRQNSGGKLNGSGSDDQINEHFYDVPEVTFVISTFSLIRHCLIANTAEINKTTNS